MLHFRQFVKKYLFEYVIFLVYLIESCTLTVHGSHTLIKIPSHFTQFLVPIHVASTWTVSVEQRSIRILHVNRVWEPHVNTDFFTSDSFSKEMIKIPFENPYTWVSTLSPVKSVTNTFIWRGEKTKTSKEIATCWNLVSLSSCCEQAAAGMLRAFPVHFVPLQSNSPQCNVHDSHADTEVHEMWDFIWNRLFGKLQWIETF